MHGSSEWHRRTRQRQRLCGPQLESAFLRTCVLSAGVTNHGDQSLHHLTIDAMALNLFSQILLSLASVIRSPSNSRCDLQSDRCTLSLNLLRSECVERSSATCIASQPSMSRCCQTITVGIILYIHRRRMMYSHKIKNHPQNAKQNLEPFT